MHFDALPGGRQNYIVSSDLRAGFYFMPQLFGRIKKQINLVCTASVDGVCGLAGQAGSARPFAPRAKLLTPCSLRPAHCALHSQNMAGDFMVPVGDCTVPVRDCTVPVGDCMVPARGLHGPRWGLHGPSQGLPSPRVSAEAQKAEIREPIVSDNHRKLGGAFP